MNELEDNEGSLFMSNPAYDSHFNLEDGEGQITVLINDPSEAVREQIFLIQLRHSFVVQEWQRQSLLAGMLNATLVTVAMAAAGFGLWMWLR